MSRDYKNGKIYCIRNYITDDIYIGSSCEKYLSKRWVKHKSNINYDRDKNMPLYQKMRELGVENFYIELIENYPCESQDQLRAREGHYIREMATLNKRIETRTEKEWREDNKEYMQEWRKQHYQENKTEIDEKAKKYAEENPDKVKQQKKDYYERNKEQIKEYGKEYRKENEELVKERKKDYYERNKEYVKAKTKAYREENIEADKQIKKDYYERNKDHLKQKSSERAKEKITCECGEVICKGSISRHIKRQKHQAYLTQQNEN